MLTDKNSKHVTDNTYALRSQCTNQCTITNHKYNTFQIANANRNADCWICRMLMYVVNSEGNQSAVLSAVSCSRTSAVLEQLWIRVIMLLFPFLWSLFLLIIYFYNIHVHTVNSWLADWMKLIWKCYWQISICTRYR